MMDWSVLILLGVCVVHLVTCPFNKVEESFNTQAVHDILYHSTHIELYDHLQFPGVVPRTFIGPLTIATLSAPAIAIINTVIQINNKLTALVFMRLVMLVLQVAALNELKRAFANKFRRPELEWVIGLMYACEFHIPFYASRMLPNCFALILVNLAYAAWLNGHNERCIFLMTFVTAVFRCDMILLAVPMLLIMLVSRRVSLSRLITVGLASSIVSMVFTVMIDSYFWQQGRLMWPELEVFYFNAILDKSSEWGVSPFHWYFTYALPRSLLLFIFFIPIAFIRGFPKNVASLTTLVDTQVLFDFLPVLFFLITYSRLPHKELRFIFPAITMLTGAAGLGFVKLRDWFKKGSGWMNKLSLLLLLVFPANFFASSCFLFISSFNYPGGYAFLKLHELALESAQQSSRKQTVHICDLAATTGVSRFGEQDEWFSYNKSDLPHNSELNKFGFDYVISEEQSLEGYSTIAQVRSFSHVSIRPPEVLLKDTLYIQKLK